MFDHLRIRVPNFIYLAIHNGGELEKIEKTLPITGKLQTLTLSLYMKVTLLYSIRDGELNW
jgi:hypothetical protein